MESFLSFIHGYLYKCAFATFHEPVTGFLVIRMQGNHRDY
jgi:hypothetical protein